MDMNTWVPTGFSLIKSHFNHKENFIGTELIISNSDRGFYFKKYATRIIRKTGNEEEDQRIETQSFSNLYRTFSEIDIVQMLAIDEYMMEDKEIQRIELELINTAFKNRTIFMIFLDDEELYQAIFDNLERIDMQDKKNTKHANKFYKIF